MSINERAPAPVEGHSPRPRDVVRAAALSGVILLSRLPFLSAGFGTDPDAWRVASAAAATARTGDYVPSRLPGFPIHELFAALVTDGGYTAVNLGSAVMSAVAVFFFALSLIRLGSRNWLLPSLALGCVPAIYVASTTAMDYLWALAFLTAALYAVLGGRVIVAGALVGLAIGCRMTSAFALVPFALLLATSGVDRRTHLRRASVLSAVAVLVGGIWYVPVISRHGLSFLSFADVSIPPLFVAYLGSIGLFGLAGSIALVVATIALLIPGVRKRGRSIPPVRPVVVAAIAGLLIPTLLFLRMPHESAYLIPAVPFLILLAGSLLPRPVLHLLAVGLIVSPFLFTLDGNGFSFEGPILADHRERSERNRYAEAVLERSAAASPNDVIVAGTWLPMLDEMERRSSRGDSAGSRFVYLLDSGEAARATASGGRIFYLKKQERFNRSAHGIDLERFGAVEFATD